MIFLNNGVVRLTKVTNSTKEDIQAQHATFEKKP